MLFPLRGGVCHPFPVSELGPAALTNEDGRNDAVPVSGLAFMRTRSFYLGLLGP